MKEDDHPIKGKRRPAAKTGKPPKPERRIREELMKAALRQFTWRGYAATTVRELVEEAGVTKPVLYYYFGNKEGLFLELMRTHFGRLEAMVDRHRQQRGGVREQLTAMLDEGFSFARENRDFFRLLHAVYFGPPGEAPFFDFDAYHQRYHDLIAELLAEGITRGQFRRVNAGDMAWIILGTMEMAIEDQICNQTSRIDRETLGRLLDLIFDGLSDDRGKDMKG